MDCDEEKDRSILKPSRRPYRGALGMRYVGRRRKADQVGCGKFCRT